MDTTFKYYNSNTSSSSSTSSQTKTSRRKLNRRRESLLTGKFFRRRICRYLLLLLLLFVSGTITFVSPLFELMYSNYYYYLPGSVYRSHEVFQNLLTDIRSDNSSEIQLSNVWRYKMKLKENKPCVTPTTRQSRETDLADKYLIIEANGGLNQQRGSICNAVAVAGLLNATLLIPRLNFHNVWRDSRQFGDIYDEEHFISTLKKYVDVVRELPKELMERYDFNISNIPTIRVPAWAYASYYLEQVDPALKRERIIRIAPFANRLATSLPPHIQYLRCLTNYHALRFSIPITRLGKSLVQRMTRDSSGSGGKYVSVHLRFEEDMVAFSCCVYDGGKYEQLEMEQIREKGWGD
ncbi:O-fucosyltransferase 11-like [Bidens hawaiensis]|uniref:O-fucosyltransferase 11-like n=1 Tax=Bidens hawaiensis TaxID=980011 RepID=UPI00404A799F